jgi:hypothetical protein
MPRSDEDLHDQPIASTSGPALLSDGITVELPEGWTVVSGGSDSPPPIAELTSFIEFADDEVVVTVLTRDYPHGPDRLFREIVGQGARPHNPHSHHDGIRLRPEVRGHAQCGGDGVEEFFVAALVAHGRDSTRPSNIAVEVVATGPPGAVTERLPLLHSMVSTIGYR